MGKKRITSLILAILVLCFALVGCSSGGVSQSEYDALVEEHSKLTEKYESLSTEHEAIVAERDGLLDDVDTLVAERDSLAETIKKSEENAEESQEFVSADFVEYAVERIKTDTISAKVIKDSRTVVFIVRNNISAYSAMIAFETDKSIKEDFEELATSWCSSMMETFTGWSVVCLMQSEDGAYITAAVNGVAIEPIVIGAN